MSSSFPTKALVSDVLGGVQEFIPEEERIRYCMIGDYDSWKEIDIHRFVHKCKEWAWKNGYSLQTRYCGRDFATVVVVDATQNDNFVCHHIDGGIMKYPAAVFSACNWVMDNKK